jgi:tRNA(adenine34) deaminase
MTNNWDQAMQQALDVANQSGSDVPVGALLIDPDGNVVSSAHNEREETADPTAHAEILAIQRAGQASKKWRLDQLTMVVTLEPCVMCAGAIIAARIPRLVFGAFDDRVGGAGSRYDLVRDSRLGSPVEVITGVMQQQCSQVLKDFFEKRR